MNERRLCLHQHIVTLKGRRYIPGYHYTVNRGSLVLSLKQARSGTIMAHSMLLAVLKLMLDDVISYRSVFHKKCSMLHINRKLVHFLFLNLDYYSIHFIFISATFYYFYAVSKHE